MIVLESQDSYIWNLDKKIIEILKEALYDNKEKIIISTNYEGICLRSCYFYDLLDDICNTFNIDKNRFEIHTSNVEEIHSEYKIIIKPSAFLELCKNQIVEVQSKNVNLLPIGCFVGKINWARLALLSWLNQFPNKALITCHYEYSVDNSNLTSQSSLQLNDNFLKFPNEFKSMADFLTTCPRTIPSNFKIAYTYDAQNVTIKDLVNDVAVKLSEGYTNIFSELVCETYFSGFTFFPTEKTFRPMQKLTPFIMFGPQGFLTNLHRCGFKTFGQYWDESYDKCAGVERILKIKQVLTQLFELDQSALQEMYTDMLPILVHNKNRLSTLTPEEMLLDE
jgi:hypothetical protein